MAAELKPEIASEKEISAVCGVKVLTWDTSLDGGNGLLHAVDSLLFGGNVGHAALQVTFPADEQGQELLRYCQKNNVPCEEITVKIFDQNGKEKEINLIQAYWSWWPNQDRMTYFLQPEIEKDFLSEWKGVNFEWDKDKIRDLNLQQPEQRHHKGKLGSRVLTYGPYEILHTRNLSEEQISFLEANREFHILTQEIIKEDSSIKIFEKKLNVRKNELEKVGNIKLTTTEKLLLEKFLPTWKQHISDPDRVTKHDLEIMENIKNDYKKRLTTRFNWIQYGGTMTVFNTLKKHLNSKRFVVTDVFRNYLQMLQYEGVEISDEVINNEEFNDKSIVEIYEACGRQLESIMAQDKEFADSVKAQRLETLLSTLRNYRKELQRKPDGEKSLEVDDSLQAMLNDLNPFLQDRSNDWKNIIDPPTDKLTLEKINIIYNVAKEKFAHVKKDIIPIRYDLVGISGIVDEKTPYVTRGLAPSGVVSLPIRDDAAGLRNGLDVKAMLEKMVELSDANSAGFNLYSKNCAKSTDAILEAGAVEEYQKNFFKNKALGYFGNPQVSYNNALEFQDAFYKRNKGYSFVNPVDKVGGAILETLLNPKASALKKTGAVLGGVIVFPVALAIFSVRKLLNPLKSIKEAEGLIDFSFSRDSKALKALAVITLAPLTITILAPLAALQYGIEKAIVDPIRSLTKTSNKTYARLENEMKEEQLNALPDEEKQKNIDADIEKRDQNQTLLAVIESLKEEIEAEPEEAIRKMNEALTKHPEKIIVFNPKSAKKIEQYMSTHAEEKKAYDTLRLQQADKVKKAVQHFREEWRKLNPPKVQSKS